MKHCNGQPYNGNNHLIPLGKTIGKMVVVMKEIEQEVSGLIPFQAYMFRVIAANAIGEGEPLESTIPIMAKHALDPPQVPCAPRVVDYDRKSAKIEWWAPSENPSVHHYLVEMQERFLVPKDSEEASDKADREEVNTLTVQYFIS